MTPNDDDRQRKRKATGRVCPYCGRWIKSLGVASHRAMHFRAARQQPKRANRRPR